MSVKLQYIPEQYNYQLSIIGVDLQNLVPQVFKEQYQQKEEEERLDEKKILTTSQKRNKVQYFIKLKKELASEFKQLCSKYILNVDEDDMQMLMKKALIVQEKAIRSVRQLAAVVVYCQYSDKIQLSIKHFCTKNCLKIKVFNKNYKAYYQFFPYHTSETRSDDEHTKNEEKEENLKIEEGFHNVNAPTLPTPQQAIEIIYDSIFTSHYFQTHRREIIQKIALRYQDVDRRKLDTMDWIETESSKMYYVLYGLLREYGANMSFQIFRDAVSNATNITLKHKSAKLVESLFKQQANEYVYEPSYTNESYEFCSFGVQDESEDFFMA